MNSTVTLVLGLGPFPTRGQNLESKQSARDPAELRVRVRGSVEDGSVGLSWRPGAAQGRDRVLGCELDSYAQGRGRQILSGRKGCSKVKN